MNATYKDGKTALEDAAAGGYSDVTQVLLAAPALSTNSMPAAVRAAVKAGHREVAGMVMDVLSLCDRAAALALAEELGDEDCRQRGEGGAVGAGEGAEGGADGAVAAEADARAQEGKGEGASSTAGASSAAETQ